MEKVTSWKELFENIKAKDYGRRLFDFIETEYKNHVCYPPKELLFNAFDLTPINEVKVVIVGQDPYHEPNQAMGLCFSVPEGVKVPPSLLNIYKEISIEYNKSMDLTNGDLTYLAKQGILMLNAFLSVRAHEPLSHNIKEYDMFFKDVLESLDQIDKPIVFLLWGGPARKLKKYITNKNRLILEANHPSPLSANRGGWFNNNHFLKTNEYLKANGIKEINWFRENSCLLV